MYRILVSAMGYDNGRSGISEYIRSAVTELARDNHVTLLILKKEMELINLDKALNIEYLICPNSLARPLVNMLWHLFVLPFTLKSSRYDFVFLPAGNRRLFCCYPIPTLVTVHDLSQFHIEGKYDRFRVLYVKKIIPYFLRKAHRIFAVSECTKSDMVRYYKMPADRIIVNYNGFDPDRLNPSRQSSGNPLHLFNGKYILYVARIEHPGKNHLNLIKAYEMLPGPVKDEYMLVFAGGLWSGGETVMEYAKASNDASRIKFMGFVDDNMMYLLYRDASLFVFPSFYEGFGFPLLEAMNSGIPVICSNTSSLPEIGGDAVLTFDPCTAGDIMEKINGVLRDKSLRDGMIARGFNRVKEFSWEKHCRKLIVEYEDIRNRKN